VPSSHILAKNASVGDDRHFVVARLRPDNYGYMGPTKAALESATPFSPQKSFGADSEIRFNVVGAGPLKTSASAAFRATSKLSLYAEKLTFRKRT